MKARIQKLALTSFRGATQPVTINFDSSRPVSLIFGDNGCGKSTIIDAVDFVCNGNFGSLNDHSMGSQPKTHVTSVGQDSKKLKVELTAPSGTFTASLSKSGPTTNPSAGCPAARILRRSQILKLLDAQPKERFDSLKTFIAVPGIEASEEALRTMCRTVKGSFDEFTRSYEQADSELVTLWEAEGKPGKSALGWATIESAKDVSLLEKTVLAIDPITLALSSAETALATLDTALGDVSPARVLLDEAEGALARVEAAQSQGNAQLVALLQDAKKYVTGHKDSPHCPVCEQNIPAEGLLGRLETRIVEMTELNTAAGAVARAKKTLQDKETLASQAQKTFCQKAKALGVLIKPSDLKEIADLGIPWDEYADLLDHATPSEAIETKGRQLLKASIPSRAPLATRKQAEMKSIAQHNAIKGHSTTHARMLKSAEAYEGLVDKMEQALEIVTKERKGYVEGVLAAISGEVEKLYLKIHPDEGMGKIKFFLNPNTQGSLNFNAQFLTHDAVPPQAYYSESHLDTLGICVFLALTKHFITDDTIVVLDDVVTSVDGPHLDRFMAMLHDEAPHFNHVIVSTHYRPWKERYRNARGPAAKTQVLELRQWSLDLGVQSDEAVTAVKELKECLAAARFDRQAVASKAGIQLESILDYLTYLYGCKMPRQMDSNYTLGALAQGIDTKLGKILKAARPGAAGQPKVEIFIKALIDDLTSKAWIRNKAGCHFNNLGADISNAEIKDFGTKVLALAEILICSDCEAFPERRPSGSHWQCECGNFELHPLIPPGAPLGAVAGE